MGKIFTRELYEEVIHCAENSVKRVDYKIFADISHILVLGTNSVRGYKAFYTQYVEQNPKGKITLVAQSSMIKKQEQFIDDRTQPVIWNDGYSEEIVDALPTAVKKSIDGFLYFSSNRVKTTDVNILELALKLTENTGIPVFCQEWSGGFYRIADVRLHQSALKLYESMCAFASERYR